MKINRGQPQTPVIEPGKAEAKKAQAASPAPATPAARGWSSGAKSWAAAGPAKANGGTARALASPTLPASSPARGYGAGFDAEVDQDTHSHALDGNKVSMLFDGVNSFAERTRLIDGARSSILFQTFIFNSDETGWALAKQLSEKAKSGVPVKVIYDAMGSGRADPKMFEMMKKAGVEVKAYGAKWKVWDLNDRWHEKHLIVDGKASIEGGMNVANEYAFGGSGRAVLSRGKDKKGSEAWRDADVKLEGPAVNDSTRAFLRNWEELGGKVGAAEKATLLPKLAALDGGSSVRVVQSNPEVNGLKRTTDHLYQHAIEHAQKSITIENAYFLPPPELRKALVAAAKRGVKVEVMTNSRASNDQGFVSDAARYFYDEMLKAGVKIHEKQGGTLHTKTATFDGALSIVGSVNLNGRSKNQDSEVAVVAKDPAVAKQLEERFRTGLAQTRAVTLEELGHESFRTNLKQWALSTLAWTF